MGGREHTSAYEKAEAFKQMHQGEAQLPVADGDDAAMIRTRTNWLAVLSNLGIAALGMIIVMLGGYLLVEGATGLARLLGVSEEIIGLTIVAIGTSMPEFVTSLVAALRGYSAVALGNIMGL